MLEHISCSPEVGSYETHTQTRRNCPLGSMFEDPKLPYNTHPWFIMLYIDRRTSHLWVASSNSSKTPWASRRSKALSTFDLLPSGMRRGFFRLFLESDKREIKLVHLYIEWFQVMSSRILLFVGQMPKVFFHLFWLSQCCDYMFCCMLNTVSQDSEKDSSSSVVQGVFLLAVAMKNGYEESNARMQIMMGYLKIKSTKNQRRMDPKFWVYIPIPFMYVKITYVFTTPRYSFGWNGMQIFRGENFNVNLFPRLKVSTIPHCHWVHMLTLYGS